MKMINFLVLLVLTAALSFLYSETVAVREIDAPVLTITNNGVVMAQVTVPVEPNANHTISLLPSTNGLRARLKVTVRKDAGPPPLPPILKDTAIQAELGTNWSDFPPEYVIVPKDPLPEGARRQWGTVVQTNFLHILLRGVVKPVEIERLYSTNYLMRIIKPVVEISEPVAAVSTNVTNF